jgi:hypothetical protein
MLVGNVQSPKIPTAVEAAGFFGVDAKTSKRSEIKDGLKNIRRWS